MTRVLGLAALLLSATLVFSKAPQRQGGAQNIGSTGQTSARTTILPPR